MVGKVLLWLPGCCCVFARVLLWLPGCCYGGQGVAIVARVLRCVCQGVAMAARMDVVMVSRLLLCVCQGVAMVARMLLWLQECCYVVGNCL